MVNILKRNKIYYGLDILDWAKEELNKENGFHSCAKNILYDYEITSECMYFVKTEILNGRIEIKISNPLKTHRNCLTCKNHYNREDCFSDEEISDILVFCSMGSFVGDLAEARRNVCENWRMEK